MQDAQEDSENLGNYYVKAKAQGQIEAKASRDIVDEGGFVAPLVTRISEKGVRGRVDLTALAVAAIAAFEEQRHVFWE